VADLAWYYSIGSSIDSILTFAQLGIVAPFQDPFNPYAIEIDAADGLVYGHGFATTAFHWGFISQAERNTLKTYCPGKSAIVYHRLRDEDWDWVYCKSVMIWQPEAPPSNGLILNFSLAFRVELKYGASLP
jgi:hypothetical protein